MDDPGGAAPEAEPEAEAELRRLRLELYRPDPPEGVRARYEALLALAAAPTAPPTRPAAVDAPVAATPDPTRSRRLRRVGTVSAATAAVAALIAAAALQIPPDSRTEAQPLPEPGVSDAADRERLASVLGFPSTTDDAVVDGQSVLEVVRRSDLPQLAVWGERRADVSVLRGEGPLVRRYPSGAGDDGPPRPLSIVVLCDEPDADYRWVVRGRVGAEAEVRDLASAEADACGAPTVSTFELPVTAVVTRFELTVPDGTGWGMALVHPID